MMSADPWTQSWSPKVKLDSSFCRFNMERHESAAGGEVWARVAKTYEKRRQSISVGVERLIKELHELLRNLLRRWLRHGVITLLVGVTCSACGRGIVYRGQKRAETAGNGLMTF